MKRTTWKWGLILFGCGGFLWCPGQTEAPPLTLKQLEAKPPQLHRRLHPAVVFLDAAGTSVLESGGPLSLATTCRPCHDTDFIAQQNYHAWVGMDEPVAPGQAPSGRAWDTGVALFGRWSPLTYRLLSPLGAEQLDLGTADWIRTMAPRHAGGGPAVFSRNGSSPLTDLAASSMPVAESHVCDMETGEVTAWDWNASGVVELNCLLCHLSQPDNRARIETTQAGNFRWASTATLNGSGLVTRTDSGWTWNESAFSGDGTADPSLFRPIHADTANCRACHGRACRCTDPLVFENSLDNWATETTGEVFSPERMCDSGMNLRGKSELSLPWDVHAERLITCVDCHHALNHPAYNQKETDRSRPAHLRFDARRLALDQYLAKPNHNLAKGNSAQGTVARRLAGSMRDCRDCHDAMKRHDFLPYKALHFSRLNCQVCHIPQVFAPARRATDWTLLAGASEPLVQHRGAAGTINDPATLIDGYQPALCLRRETQGTTRLTPYNLIVSWFWVGGDPARPVRQRELNLAIFAEDDSYHDAVVAALDEDGDARLSPQELRLDRANKVQAIASRLEAVGVVNPRIEAEIQPYSLSHGVATPGFATKACSACHSPASNVNRAMELSAYTPGGVLPRLVGDARTMLQGQLVVNDDGALVFRPRIDPQTLYLHGTDRLRWLDIIGLILVGCVLLGSMLHGGLRWLSSRENGKEE